MRILSATVMAIALATVLAGGARAGDIPDDVDLEPVLPTGTFPGALGFNPMPDGDGRRLVIQQNGVIRLIDGDDNLVPEPFVDVGNLITTSGSERGLLDIAFHPDYASNGRFYLHYSAGGDLPPGAAIGDTVVAEFTVTGDPDIGNETPERIMLVVGQDFSNHNGGQMHFGPDGYLYLGLGDGGSGGDPCNRAQTLDPDNIQTGGSCRDEVSVALLGKMLRLDVDDTTPAGSNNLCAAAGDGSAEYAVPADNPFADDPDACGEVWAYGLRNPWRWSFDRDTDDMWIGDVGQGTWEEVDLEPAASTGGTNWGWSDCEGSWVQGSTTTPCDLKGATDPVIEYRRNDGNCSITGGYRYRGPVNSLQGTYIYGDYCTGNIWFANEDGGDWTSTLFATEGFDLRSFGQDAEGHVYVVRSGGLWRFAGDESDLVFADGFEPPEK